MCLNAEETKLVWRERLKIQKRMGKRPMKRQEAALQKASRGEVTTALLREEGAKARLRPEGLQVWCGQKGV